MTDGTEPDAATLTPDEAFSVLGNETRMGILQTLADAGSPLSFSELRERVGVRASAGFNYHLDQVTGHFVRRTDAGYELRRPGERVIEAVLSGAVTEAPVMDRTPIDWACHYCGTRPIEVDYREEQVGVYCTECEGMYGGANDPDAAALPAERKRLYYSYLPPAGVSGRSAEEMLLVAGRWTNAEVVTTAFGICPRCSARLRESAVVCENHATADGLCEECDRRYAALYRVRCTNCVHEAGLVLGNKLLAHTDLQAFMIEHGLNPAFPESERYSELITVYDEDVRSIDPLEVRITFEFDGDEIEFTVGDGLDVIEVTENPTPESD